MKMPYLPASFMIATGAHGSINNVLAIFLSLISFKEIRMFDAEHKRKEFRDKLK
jgi:hypothetical protein